MDPQIVKTIQSNRKRLDDEIAGACDDVGRTPEDITVITVSKYVDAEITAAAVNAGCEILGENRPQQIWEKSEALNQCLDATDDAPEFCFHMIGHLQRNKVRRTLPLVSMIHSVDSTRLLKAINDHSAELQIVAPVFIEVNITGDESKTGLEPDGLAGMLDLSCSLANVDVQGLMGMASLESKNDLDSARRDFASIRALRDQEQERLGGDCDLRHLSMGMSNDFVAAVSEGATMIRIGSRLFEGAM